MIPDEYVVLPEEVQGVEDPLAATQVARVAAHAKRNAVGALQSESQ